MNEDDPVKAQLVDDRIQALITEANLILAQRISESAEVYLNVLIEGGDFEIPLLGDTFSVLGLDNAGDDPRGRCAASCRRARTPPSRSTR